MADLVSLHQLLARQGVLPAAELRARLGISPATLSRLLGRAPETVVRLGRGRATRYALPRRIAGLAPKLPVYRVDGEGRPRHAAELWLLAGSPTWVALLPGETPNAPEATGGKASQASRGDQLYAGLPPVLHDMAPAGYLGRGFALAFPELGLPRRLSDWSDDHRLIALARRGEELPGELILGEESLDRFLAAEPQDSSERDFPALAEASALGGAGSSAAGEQPKFAACCHGRQVLVKFTPGDGSPSDLRWRDLLAAEAIALAVLGEQGLAVPAARLVDVATRRFLEVERFDRVGRRGRRGVLSLAALDDELFGSRDSWTAAAARLCQAGLLSAADGRTMRLLEAFGMLIANGDCHFGNISFFADGLRQPPSLVLAPAYDMLPMDAAPRAGVLPPLPAVPPRPLASLLDVWDQAAALADRFWARLVASPEVSGPFRAEAEQRSALRWGT